MRTQLLSLGYISSHGRPGNQTQFSWVWTFFGYHALPNKNNLHPKFEGLSVSLRPGSRFQQRNHQLAVSTQESLARPMGVSVGHKVSNYCFGKIELLQQHGEMQSASALRDSIANSMIRNYLCDITFLSTADESGSPHSTQLSRNYFTSALEAWICRPQNFELN